MVTKRFHSYQTILNNETIQFLVANETEYGETSFLIPTLCFGRPAYVQFAVPVTILKHNQEEIAPPSHWWAVAAENNQLIFFTLYQNQPFALTQRWLPQVVSTKLGKKQNDAINEVLPLLETEIEALADFFFTKIPPPAELQQSFWQHFTTLIINQQAQQQYQALAPDFFRWVALPETV